MGKLEPGSRRGFLIGALALMSAPMIVRAEALMPIKVVDLYDTRCLCLYEIATDRLILRLDRSLQTMMRPSRRSYVEEIPLAVARKFLPKFAFDMQPPEGIQRHVDMPITTHQLASAGYNLWPPLGEYH